MPFDKLVAPVCPDAKLRKLVRNMIYDGVLAKLLGIDLARWRRRSASSSGRRQGRHANAGRAQGRLDYAEENFTSRTRSASSG